MSSNKGTQRLLRLLKLIPFLQKNNGVDLRDAAELFGISEEQLIADLNLIWMCGLPGYTHLELIDVSYDSGYVTIQNAETLAKPMKITYDEGAALLLAVENLIAIAPANDVKILGGIRQKLMNLLALPFETADLIPSSQKRESENALTPVLPELLQLLEDQSHLLDIEYYSATLDEYLKLTVEPIELVTMNGFAYLLGYRSSGGGAQHFRIDRIRKVSKSSQIRAGENRGKEMTLPDEAIEVEIAIAPEAYWFIQKWRLSALEYQPSRKLFTGTVKVHHRKWLERATLSAAGALVIEGPEPVRAEIVRLAHRTLEKYRHPLK